MSFGFGIGDLVLCTQIAYRLYTAVTSGRANAPRDLKELEDVLFGLYCGLDHLQKVHATILDKAAARSGNDAAQIKQQLGLMISSCLHTLEELDNTTAKYREAADDPPRRAVNSQYKVAGVVFSRQVKAQVKVQWRRVLWDYRGDSLSKYRQKLQSHTDAINLLLSSIIWLVPTAPLRRISRYLDSFSQGYYGSYRGRWQTSYSENGGAPESSLPIQQQHLSADADSSWNHNNTSTQPKTTRCKASNQSAKRLALVNNQLQSQSRL